MKLAASDFRQASSASPRVDDAEKSHALRLSVRGLLIWVTLIAVAFGGARFVWVRINGDGDEVARRLLNDPRIEVVDLEFDYDGIADIEKSVYSCELRLKGRPAASFLLIQPSLAFLNGRDHAAFCRIGDQFPMCFYEDPQRSQISSATSIPVGRGSPLADVLPGDMNGLDDVIERYDELLEAVRNWPTVNSPKSVPWIHDGEIRYWTSPVVPPAR